VKVIERVKVGKRGDGSLIRVEGQANWFSLICVRGKQHELSTGTPDLKLAKRFHRQKLDELAADRQGLRQFTTPQHRQLQFGSLLDDVVSDYKVRRVKSLGSALSHIKPLREHFGDWRAMDINFRAIEAYITKRQDDKKANATINRELELLRRALRLAHDHELLPAIPKVKSLTENNTRQGFFERADLEAVVAALPEYLRDFTRFAYLTGWRKGEIVSLRWSDVDRDAGAIRLRPEAAKTGRGRTVMLEGDLRELIDRRWESRLFEKDGNVRVTAVVFHREGKPVGDFKKSWATACRAAGVPDKLFHDLRRTAARNMVRAGVPERVAMAVTGHVTRSMFDRYNIVSEDDLRMAAQKTTMYVDTLPTKRAVDLREDRHR
jgi:integrase